jgi:hypothetical protein
MIFTEDTLNFFWIVNHVSLNHICSEGFKSRRTTRFADAIKELGEVFRFVSIRIELRGGSASSAVSQKSANDPNLCYKVHIINIPGRELI